MKLEPECIGCLFNQVLSSFKLLRPDISHNAIIKAQKKLMEYLMSIDFNKNASPIVGKFAYNLVSETLGERDPYKSLKEEYNCLALELYDETKQIIENAKDPLFESIVVAAVGNTIDFATQHRINFITDLKKFSPENLKINDYSKFRKALDNSKHLLIIGDNAGEIVFDKLLILNIKNFYPDIDIFYSVRSAPIINDATIEDAKFVGLTEVVQVIESCPAPGVDLSSSTKEFKEHFYLKGGVILSKGQGNFESLYQTEIPDKDIFYLLKAKCNLMERIFNVKIGDLIFKKKTLGF